MCCKSCAKMHVAIQSKREGAQGKDYVLQVEVSKLDVADMEEAKGVVALAQKQAPVGGIFHLAMILQDRWMANQVTEQAPLVTAPVLLDS